MGSWIIDEKGMAVDTSKFVVGFGKWILVDTYHPCDSFKCSKCGIVLSEYATDMKGMSYYRNFCPNCGCCMALERRKKNV